MAITTFSQILEFDEKLEDLIQYSEKLKHFFTANDFNDAKKKRAILLTIIGPKEYNLHVLRTLVAPEKLDEKSYTDLVKAMKKHQSPKLSQIMQRHRFLSRSKQYGESISTFMSELRALAEFLQFRHFPGYYVMRSIGLWIKWLTHSMLSTFGTHPNLINCNENSTRYGISSIECDNPSGRWWSFRNAQVHCN